MNSRSSLAFWFRRELLASTGPSIWPKQLDGLGRTRRSSQHWRTVVKNHARVLDEELKGRFGLRVRRTPVRAPKANAYCERLTGTVRRECFDFMILLNERHLRQSLQCWVKHYNKGRPHSRLGPGFREKTSDTLGWRPTTHRHRLPPDCVIRVTDVLGGLHHEYWLDESVA
jgi:putative transposase